MIGRVAGLVVGLILTAGCAHAAPQLAALKADPMATVAIPGIEFGEEYEHPEGEAMGKPVMASFSRPFVVTAGTPRQVLRAFKKVAEANGWTTTAIDEDSYQASKKLERGGRLLALPADLTVAFSTSTEGGLRMTQE